MTAPRFSIIIPTYGRRRSLERLLESIRALDYPRECFEVIVVNDGSPDGTTAFLEGAVRDFPVGVITIPNSGPAAARNRGALTARGEFLVFVDDDCAVPRDWLRTIDEALHVRPADILGGSVRNALTGNPYAVAYEENHRFFAEALNSDGGQAAFLTTNNLVCRAGVFRTLGGYDERFHVGGEDREFVARALDAGSVVRHEARVRVDHFHDFRLMDFIRQYYRFGKGAYLLHAVIAREKGIRTASLGAPGYARLLATVGRGKRIDRRAATIALTFLGQASASLGFLASSWEGLSDIAEEKRRIHSPGKLGVQGRVRELVQFLFGTGVSSAIGFLVFLLLGRMLSVQQYGVFTFAFSMTTFMQTLGAVGLASAVTRHSVESLKNDGRPEREPVLMSALALLGIVLAALLGVLAAVWNPLLSRIAVSWEGNALPLLLAGIVTATAFEFLISAYQVRLNLLRQASLRLIVSVLRAAVIVSLLAAGVRSPLVIYAGFFAPAAAGAVAAGMEFIALSPAGERPRFATMLRLAAYGGWQTLSAATVILLQHAGALVLGPVAGEEQVGLYGLGMTFSFVYGVIGSSLGSYYVPIAARLRSDDDVRTFLRRTNRINIPIILLALASLVVAVPVFQHIFGPAKQEAVPVFLLLSLAAIIGIGTVASHSLFHYFLQPRSITLAQGAGIAAFLLCALALIRYGAVGMAAAYLGSRVALWLTLRLLIRNEFRKRGIAP